VSAFIDAHRERFGVEPVCRTLGVSASAYYQRASGQRSARAVEDQRLLDRIREVHAANYYAYGYRRMWKALLRAGETVPRCQVQRLMRSHGIVGAKRRGRPWRTTRPDPDAHRRPDLVHRDFSASGPDELCAPGLSSSLAVVEYLGWFNHDRMHEALGDVPPVEAEGSYAPRTETDISLEMKRGSQLTRSP
jgi:putative transposase